MLRATYTQRVAEHPPYLDWIPLGDNESYFRYFHESKTRANSTIGRDPDIFITYFRTRSSLYNRRLETYDLLWRNIRLDSMIVAAAPLAGPIAMIRNDKKAVVLQPNQSFRPTLSIYSLSGNLLHSMPWEKGRVAGLGWTENENLAVVVEDGTVFLFDLFGTPVSQFGLGQDARDATVTDCFVWGTGLVALTANLKLIAVTGGFDNPRPRTLASAGFQQPPTSWTVLPPHQSPTGDVEVFVAVDKTIFTVSASKAQNQLLSNGPFSRMAISPNGKLLLTASDTKLWVVSIDFQRSIREFPLEKPRIPDSISWCGTDAVAACWAKERTLTVASVAGGHASFDVGGFAVLVPEVDGCRVVTDERCEFLQRLPNATESVFKIGSTSSAAVLYDALHDFETRRPDADEKIRMVKPNLSEAVDTCIEAAGCEFDVARQKALLKAASFGKCFLEVYNSERFVDMARSLRVLNAVREAGVGIPLTYPQYLRLTVELLIDRLIHRRLHLLALKVCDFLGLRGERVVSSWACAKIRTSKENEDTLSRIVLDRLASVSSKYPGLSYADIAKEARAHGRNQLAVKLLDLEVIPSNQVFPLLSMKEYDLALTKAVQSGDTDLAYSALLAIRRELPTADFFRLLRNKPAASRLFEVYCREKDTRLLQDFYYQDDRRVDEARLVIKEYLATKDPNEKIAKLRTVHKLYSEDRDSGFEAKAADDQIRLTQLQVALEKELRRNFQDKTISGVLFELTVVGEHARALKVKNDFKVPDKRFWWIRVRALTKAKNWTELRAMAKSKSPIGYAPFVNALLDAGEPAEALHFVDKVEPSDRRFTLQRRINELLHQPRQAGSAQR